MKLFSKRISRTTGTSGAPCRWRGIILMEMIVVVLLLAGFSVVITALFMAAYHAQVDSVRRDALLHRIDSAMGAMRRDVWGARHMTFAGGHLDLTLGQTRNVRWATGKPNQLTRKETGDHESSTTWIDLPAVDAVEVHGPIVTLAFKEPRQREAIAFVSEVLLGGEQ